MGRRFNHVSIGKSLSLAIFSVIALLIFFFVPISFGTSEGVIFTFKTLPIISDGSIVVFTTAPLLGIAATIPSIPVEVIDIFINAFNYGIYAILIIFVVNFVSGLLLALTRSNGLRAFFKVLGIIMGIIMIILGLLFLIYVAGCVCLMIQGAEILEVLKGSGLVMAFVMMIVCFISANKNFKNYKPRD